MRQFGMIAGVLGVVLAVAGFFMSGADRFFQAYLVAYTFWMGVVLGSLALLISTVGLRVQGWGDPQQFLRAFPRQDIGAIVLDVRMPGISGLTVLDTLVAQGVDQPVIMLTGHGTVDMCRRAFKAGAAEFLEKPVDDEALLEALQNAVRQHVKSRERLGADRAARERYAQLSEREKEVAGLIVEGLTN